MCARMRVSFSGAMSPRDSWSESKRGMPCQSARRVAAGQAQAEFSMSRLPQDGQTSATAWQLRDVCVAVAIMATLRLRKRRDRSPWMVREFRGRMGKLSCSALLRGEHPVRGPCYRNYSFDFGAVKRRVRSRKLRRPEGAKHASPGQRPGKRPKQRSGALKGQKKVSSRHNAHRTQFRIFVETTETHLKKIFGERLRHARRPFSCALSGLVEAPYRSTQGVALG